MLKYFVSAVLCCVLSMFNAYAASSQYKEGVHYEVVADERTPNNEIREFYSYWCGHCFAMQEDFEFLKNTFKGRADFVRNPVDLLGGNMGPETQIGFAVAKSMGLEDVYNRELFTNMHVNNLLPQSHSDMLDFFESIGVPRQKAEQGYNSFITLGMISDYNQWVEKTKIDAVPELIVNGKYKLTMSAFNSIQEMVPLIEYLFTID